MVDEKIIGIELWTHFKTHSRMGTSSPVPGES